jgi:ABC-type phosphate transport system substrate-binding protein
MSRLALAAGAAALSLTMLAPMPAGAAKKPKVKPLSFGVAGSDTTYWMMKLISGKYVSSPSNGHHNKVTMIPPLNAKPFPLSTTVPKDYSHPAYTWDSHDAAHTPPDGSSAGITALSNDKTGQISWARSSRGPKTGETSTMDFWAYALGALDFVTFPGSHAPAAGLTQQNLIDIYTCNPATHAPYVSDWSQVGGTAGTIKKYAPQTLSGTYSVFVSKLLNGAAVDANCDASHLSTFHQEHDSRAVTAADKPFAIDAFDWARWNAQRKGFEGDLRNGSEMGAFGTSTSNRKKPTTGTVKESGTRFYGTRYVFNVVRKGNHPSKATNQRTDIIGFVGVNGSKKGYICSGKAKAFILKAGFVPLRSGKTGGLGLPKSNCRLNPTAL